MLSYQLSEWILFFFIYAFLGWIFESTYVSIRKRKFVNRGFLKGPFIPIYGEGAIIMLLATIPVRGNLLLEFLMGMLGATALELVVGAAMDSIFKMKYWDYSDQRFNFRGYICLSSSLAWGGLTIVMDEVLHRPIETFVLELEHRYVYDAALVIGLGFLIDTISSSKDAWNLRMVLAAIQKAKQEIQEIQQMLEERKEELQLQLSQKSMELVQKGTEFRQKGSELLHSVSIKQRITEILEKEEITQRLESAISYSKMLESHLHIRRIGILRRNPDATSKRFKEALETIKENIKGQSKTK